MTTQEFFNKWNGKGIDFDGYYGFQCMDVYQQYVKEVLGGKHVPAPAAADVWAQDKFDSSIFDKVPNTPDGVPQEGDVVIWNKKAGGGYGHIAVFYAGNVNNFTSFEQNWPTGSLSHFQVHDYTNVSGWLRPKKLPTQTPDETDPMVCDKKSVRDELVSKASKYDEFKNAGYTSLVDVTSKVTDLQKDKEQLELTKKKLEGTVKTLENDKKELERANQTLQEKIEYLSKASETDAKNDRDEAIKLIEAEKLAKSKQEELDKVGYALHTEGTSESILKALEGILDEEPKKPVTVRKIKDFGDWFRLTRDWLLNY